LEDWSAESAFAAAVKLLGREPGVAKGMRVPEHISVDDYDDLPE